MESHSMVHQSTAPYVAGLAALILENNPDMSPEQLLTKIQQNTEPGLFSLQNEYDYATGYGTASASFPSRRLGGYEMKTNNIPKDELMGRNLLSLLVIAGITFSAISFFMLDEEIQEIFSYTEVTPIPPNICEDGLCNFKDAKETSNHMFVQLGEELSKTQQVLKNEEFTNLKLVKNFPIKESEVSGNKVTLFAEKDSFIREGVQNSNEGSNQVLRIMGTGPTNNRALIAFNQDDIQNVTTGKTLESATLKLYIESNNQNWGDGQAYQYPQL